MSQNYTIDSFASTNVGQSDLQNMENNFECLRSTFSGAAAPSNAVAGKQWFDTTQKLFKIRNDANDAWLGVLTGTTSLKMLVYRNTAEDGWAIDSGVTDRVIAVKGGATYTTGAATAGSWTLPSHTLVESEMPGHIHTTENDTHNHTFGGATPQYLTSGIDGSSGSYLTGEGGFSGGATNVTIQNDTHNHTVNSTGDDGSHNHGATYRPAAAVVTIQYPDI